MPPEPHRTETSARGLARVYLVAASLIVDALCMLTPPFQVPDEQQHFFRAYQISELRLLSTIDRGHAGGMLPSSLIEFSGEFLGGRELHLGHVFRLRSAAETLRWWTIPLDPSRREFIDFSGAAAYWPPAYVAQAAAIAIGRAAGLGPLGLLYAARLLNGIVAVLLIAAAVRLLPAGRLTLFVVALLPMALYQIASCSADAATIATVYLLTALTARAIALERWTAGEIAAAAVSAAIFCPLKPVYAPMLLLGLPFAFTRTAGGLRAQAIILAAGLGTTVAWLMVSTAVSGAPFPGVEPAGQVAFIAAHPLDFLSAIGVSVEEFGFRWAIQFVGVLGWASVPLRWQMLALPAGLLLVCGLLPRQHGWRPRGGSTLWFAATGLACILLTFTALYMLWTPVGASRVDGMQGRYFLPLAALAAMLLQSAVPVLGADRARFYSTMISALAVGEALLTAVFVARVFGLV